MHLLDITDRRILLAMASAKKRTGSAIATALNLGRNTVQSRMTRLENEILESPDRRIPPAALGYGLLSFIELHVDQRYLEEISAKLAAIPEVLEAHGLTGNADILVRVAAKDAEQLFRVHGQLLHIDGVNRADSALAMAQLVPYRTTALLRHSLKSPAQ